MNNNEAARQLGRITSERKAEAARRNGKLGGRPRKSAKAPRKRSGAIAKPTRQI